MLGMRNKPVGFILEHGKFGPDLVVVGQWYPDIGMYISKHKIRSLTLNYARGWRGQDLHFLEDLVSLEGISVTDWHLDDASPINYLQNLKRLKLETYCKTEIDFSCFPNLEDCFLEWRPKAKSVFRCVSLKRLFINRYNGVSTTPFQTLVNLESLTLSNGPIKDLDGLSSLVYLNFLGLYNLRRLPSLRGIENLTNLRRLEVDGCGSIQRIDEVGGLNSLEVFHLCDDKKIESIEPVAVLKNLREFLFYGTTNIIDGDLTPLLGVSRPLHVMFQNRKHYSHRREDLWKILNRN